MILESARPRRKDFALVEEVLGLAPVDAHGDAGDLRLPRLAVPARDDGVVRGVGRGGVVAPTNRLHPELVVARLAQQLAHADDAEALELDVLGERDTRRVTGVDAVGHALQQVADGAAGPVGGGRRALADTGEGLAGDAHEVHERHQQDQQQRDQDQADRRADAAQQQT